MLILPFQSHFCVFPWIVNILTQLEQIDKTKYLDLNV